MAGLVSRFVRYLGDPTPGEPPRKGSADETVGPEPTEQVPGTMRDGIGVALPNFAPSTNTPIIGQPNPARAFLALLPVNFGHVKIGQAGGARRLFPNRAPGAYAQSSTEQARDSRRIIRPTAGPWDRGTGVGA
jgi:hypothetical protein